MREPDDVLRSLARYAWQLLPPMPDPESSSARPLPDLDWQVRIDSQILKHPQVIVTQTTPETFSGGRWVVERSMGVRWACYCGPQATEERATQLASQISSVFFQGIRQGVEGSRVNRIPLHDYSGVPLDAAVDVSLRDPKDFISLSNVAVQPLPDPEDRRRITVLVSATATWMQNGERPEITMGPTTASTHAKPLPH